MGPEAMLADITWLFPKTAGALAAAHPGRNQALIMDALRGAPAGR